MDTASKFTTLYHSFRTMIFIVVAIPFVSGQTIELIPMITPPYPNEFHEFEEDFDTYTITMINHSNETRSLYMHVSIQGDNGVSGMMDESYKPGLPFELGPQEVYIMTGQEFRDINEGLTLDQFEYDGISTLQLAIGVLPEGNYEICITAFDFQTDELISTGCSMQFPVGNGDVPRIIYPFEGDIIPQTLESFPITWEAPSSNPTQSMDFEYTVKIVDLTIYGDQDYEDVFLDGGVSVTLEENIQGMTSIFYNDEGDDPPLEPGHRYGVRVQVIDPMNDITFENNGYSEVRTFFYGAAGADSTGSEEIVNTIQSDCESRCFIPTPNDVVAMTSLDSIPSLRMGHFIIENFDLEPMGNLWQGEGEIIFNFLNDLRVRVSLNGISWNAQGEILTGYAAGIQDEGTIAEFTEHFKFPILDGQMDMAASMIPEGISSEVGHYLRDTRMISALAGNGTIGLPIGFEESLAGVSFTIGITDLLLRPNGAKAKVISGTSLPMYEGDNWLLFVGDSVCIHPAGFGGEYNIGLGADLVVRTHPENGFELTFNGVDGDDPACNLVFNCEGLQLVSMKGSLDFPRSCIVPELEDGTIGEEKVNAAFEFDWSNAGTEDSTQTNGAHWIASLEIDRFQITRLNGWSFDIEEAWIDMSEIGNPADIQFPQGFETTGPDFTGVYITEASIQPPSSICKSYRPSILVTDLIIDPQVYAHVQIDSILQIGQGQMDGWAISLDEFNLDIFQNQLIEARLDGRMHLPLLDTSSFIQYYALIGQGETDPENQTGSEPYAYSFNAEFTEDVKYNFLIAEGVLYDDSVLEVNYDPQDTASIYVHVVLHGTLNVDSDEFLPASFPELPASIALPELEYAFDFHSQSGFDPDGTYVSFASPSKFLSGFPVNMESFDFDLSTTEDGHISFDFGVAISFAEDELDLAAEAQFSLVSRLTTLNVMEGVGSVGEGVNAIITFHTLLLDRVEFDSIMLDVQISELSLTGSIGFYNNPLEGGGRDKGVRGDLDVNLPIGPSGIQARLTAIFGTYGTPALTYSEDFYNYWYVDGLVSFPTAIQFGTLPLGLYGLGGGVGYNMIQSQAPVITNGVIEGESEFTPTYESFLISLKVMLGTTPKPDAFNADLTLTAQFVEGGLDMILIDGDAYIMTPMSDRSDPQIYLGCDIAMYMANETRPWSIEGGLDVAVNVADGVLVGNQSPAEIPNQLVSGSFHASPDLFYCYMGQPDFNYSDNMDPRGSALLDLGFLQASAKTYMMLGHGVPTSLPPLPQEIQNILNNPEGDLDGTASATTAQQGFDPNMIETGTGFAHGSFVSLSADIDALLLYATLAVHLGYDMNITDRSTVCSNTGELIGINGWYAEGQAYAGLEGSMGIRIKVLGKERDIRLFELAAAIALSGGAPNPFYFGGQASVSYSVLNGLVEGNSSFAFSVGERCTPALNDPLVGIDFYEMIEPGQDERGVFVGAPMHVKLSLPVYEDIVIPQDVLDANGNVIDQTILRYRPEISWQLVKQGQTNSIALQNVIWADESRRQQFYLLPQTTLDAQTWYELKLKVIAWDYQTSTRLFVDGKEWSQDTTVRFKTGTLPKDLYNFVTHTVPLQMERYFLRNESGNGLIYFSQALNQSHYFPTSDTHGSGYSYYVRFTELESKEETEVNFTYHSSNVSGYHFLRFNLPPLDPSALYAMQVIRKSPVINQFNSGVGSGRRTLADLRNNEGQTTSLQIQSQETIMPAEKLDPGEFLLFHSYFGTSEFATLKNKVEAADITNVSYVPNTNQLYGKKAKIWMTLAEPFEERDFNSFYPSSIYPFMEFLPRIRLLDLFTTGYHKQHAEKRLLNYKTFYHDNVMGYPFVIPWPVETDFEWEEPQIYRLPGNRVQTSLQPPLALSEVEDLWNGVSQNSGVQIYSSQGIQLVNNSCQIIYDTHFKVNKDRKVVLDWAADYFTTWAPVFPPQHYQSLFENQEPQFINRYNQLMNDDLRLENYEGTYSLQWGRNISSKPMEEVINIFSMHNLSFETPGSSPIQVIQMNPLNSGVFSK